MIRMPAQYSDEVNSTKPKKASSFSQRHHALLFSLFVAAMVAPLFFVETKGLGGQDDTLAISSFVIIGSISYLNIFYASYKSPFTLNCAHWIFVLFFLFYTPLIQYLSHRPPVQTDIGKFYDLVLSANFLVLVWVVFYSVVYGLSGVRKRSSGLYKHNLVEIDSKYVEKIVLSILSMICLLVAFIVLGWEAVVLRGAASATAASDDKSSSLLVNSICRTVPVIATAALFMSKPKRDGVFWACASGAGLSALILNNPLAIARFWLGSILIGIVNFSLRRRSCTALWLPAGFVLAVIFIMPLLTISRYSQKVADLDFSVLQRSSFVEVVTGGDFDAYSMIIDTLDYSEHNDIDVGKQLFGNVLFFIPRSVWKKKPYGSGQMVAEYYRLSNKNLSCPLPAEGYINFGMLGVVAYAVASAWMVSAVDRFYWKLNLSRRFSLADQVLHLSYPFLIGVSILVMRGDFLTGYSTVCGIFFACVIVLSITNSHKFFSFKESSRQNNLRKL